MTFYEKELHRLFDDSERISDDTVFAGKTMITKIGEDLRAKVQFVNTKISGQYDALRLTIINRHEGTVDSETFKFKDIIGMKGDREPHIWEDGQRVDWYIYHPTASDYNFINIYEHRKKYCKIQKSKRINAGRIGRNNRHYQSSGFKMGIGGIDARYYVTSRNCKCFEYYVG